MHANRFYCLGEKYINSTKIPLYFPHAVPTLAMIGISFLLLAFAITVQCIEKVEIRGNAFFYENGTRFYIRGVDYQPGATSNLTDPLTEVTTCTRDVERFTQLGVNTIRVYSVDNSQSHETCMQMLEDAGIYLLLDVNTPDASISRRDAECSYNADYLQNVFATIDLFEKYDNVLGFFAANEVINDEDTIGTAPYVKAVVRDMKRYMRARNYRQIPVGYSAADVSQVRKDSADYFNCGDDADARVDMMGINDYSWCGRSSFQQSGYADKMEEYEGYSVPLFLSEFGCNEVPGARPFTEIGSLFSSDMSPLFSGGLVYEYSEEENGYGLVNIVSSTEVELKDDFVNLSQQLNSTSNPSGDGGYSSDNEHSECPDWDVDDVPDMPEAAEIFFERGAGEGLGFNHDGTQWMCYNTDMSNYFSGVASSSTSRRSSTSRSSNTGSSTSGSPTSSSDAATTTNGAALVGGSLLSSAFGVLLCLL